MLDFDAFRQRQRIFHINAEVPHRIFDLGVTQKNLSSAQIAGRLVDNRRLRSPERIGSIVFASKADRRALLVNATRILPRTHMGRVVDSAGKRIILGQSAAMLEPCQKAPASVRHDFELNGSARLLLNYHCPRSQLSTRHQVADLDLHQITAPQFAVDRKIKQRPISKSVFAIEMKANGPNLSWLQRALCSNLPAGIPRGTWYRIVKF